MQIMPNTSRDFCPSDSCPILVVCAQSIRFKITAQYSSQAHHGFVTYMTSAAVLLLLHSVDLRFEHSSCHSRDASYAPCVSLTSYLLSCMNAEGYR